MFELVVFEFLLLMSFLCEISAKCQLNILIFGGNGFIGAEVSRRLLSEGHNLTLVSRGHWSWDARDVVKPFIKRHIFCDRYLPDECIKLKQMIDSQETFDCIIDFSAYKLRAVKPFYNWLCDRHLLSVDSKKVPLYIYISTDSVYEVCEKKTASDEKYKELDSVRPVDAAEREKLNKFDSYGHKKLEIEEFLIESHAKGGLPYLIFRLPDVIGERDSTSRFWSYQMWIEMFSKLDRLPIPVPKPTLHLRSSFVYVADVAAAISLCLQKPRLEIENQIFNIGFSESKSLTEFLSDLAVKLQISQSDQEKMFAEGVDGDFYFPSVRFGAVDVAKSNSVIGGYATSWSQALSNIVDFYKQAYWLFPKEADRTADSLLADLSKCVLLSDDAIRQFRLAVRMRAARRDFSEL